MCSPCSLCERTSVPRCALSLQAPLRMEMKGVGNEFLSARIPDLTTINQLRGENQRETERGRREMEVRDGGKKRLQGKHRAFFHFFTPPPLVPSCQAATMLSWSFFQSIGNRKGPPHGGRGGEGNAFGERQRRRQMKRRRNKTGLKTKTGGQTLCLTQSHG